MQNRYVGDIGDFGKLGLLRQLQLTDMSIGVNWYLIPNENHNSDGRYVGYLKQESYRNYDPFLYEALKKIVFNKQRSINTLQSQQLLQATFYSDELDFSNTLPSERIRLRSHWHTRALDLLSKSEIVFVDPDNGLLTPSANGTKKANKYVSVNEIIDYYEKGSTVIYYQHKARRPDDFYLKQHRNLQLLPQLKEAKGLLLKFTTTSHRYYGFIIQPKHFECIHKAVDKMLETSWADHFCLL